MITITKEQLEVLLNVAQAVKSLPFGESVALPWCRESFPVLDNAMATFEIVEQDIISLISTQYTTPTK